jgi:hypothetical protein
MRSICRSSRGAPRAVVLVLALTVAAAGAAGCDSVPAPTDPTVPLIPQENVEISGPLQNAYREDAARLALRSILEAGGAGRNEVRLPPALVSTFYNALTRVHAMNHPARDSVVEMYRIHTFPNPATHELIVGVDPGQEWVQRWQRGDRLTGNSSVDRLMEEFNLQLERYYPWSSGHAVVLRSAAPLNILALARRFSDIRSVRYAEPNGFGGDGHDIRARLMNSGVRLDYSVGFGDCPAGCIGRHTWSFLVDSSGHTTYLGSSGDPVPPPRQG